MPICRYLLVPSNHYACSSTELRQLAHVLEQRAARPAADEPPKVLVSRRERASLNTIERRRDLLLVLGEFRAARRKDAQRSIGIASCEQRQRHDGTEAARAWAEGACH